jgi:hypothetical protein
MSTFTLKQIRADAQAWIDLPGNSRHQLARLAGVEWASLDRFLSDETVGLSGKTIEKIWPIIYRKEGDAA